VAVGGGTCGVVHDGLDAVFWDHDDAGGVVPDPVVDAFPQLPRQAKR
jgi:hypothetical protein